MPSKDVKQYQFKADPSLIHRFDEMCRFRDSNRSREIRRLISAAVNEQDAKDRNIISA